MVGKTQTEHMIFLKAKSSKNKKINKLLVCGKKTFNPKTQACICLGNGRCIVVKKKRNRKKKTKRQQQLEKKQNQTINYLNRFPERVSEAFGRPSNNYSSNLQRTNAETLLHRTLRDRYEVNERDIPRYIRYLDSLRSDDRLTDRNPRRQIPQTELERELVEEMDVAEDLQPIVNNNVENPRRVTEPKSPRQLEAEKRFREARRFYGLYGYIKPIKYKYDPKNKDLLLPPPSTRNIRLMREYQQNQRAKDDLDTRLRLTESNIERLQERLGEGDRIVYTADNDGISITERELGKLGVVPTEEDDKNSVLYITTDEIKDLIKKINSNKRYSFSEINTRREAFLKMIESVNKQKRDDPNDNEPAEVETIKDNVEEEKNEDTKIDIDTDTSTYDLDSPTKLRTALMRNELSDDEDLDMELFSSYSLQSLADNEFKEEIQALSLMGDDGLDDIDNYENKEELEMEGVPLSQSTTAPAYPEIAPEA